MADTLHAGGALGRDVGAGGLTVGEDTWSSGYLPHLTPSSLSRLEAALLVIRVGPLVGLVLSLGVGWIQRLFTLTVAWIMWPLTGRPLQQLGSMCQSMWSGDYSAMSGSYFKYSGALIYVNALLLMLWWLTPHGTSAKVGLLSITAMPCFTVSLYYGLQSIATSASHTLSLMLNGVIHPLTHGSIKGARKLWKHGVTARHGGSASMNCTTSVLQCTPLTSGSTSEKHTRSKFHLSGTEPPQGSSDGCDVDGASRDQKVPSQTSWVVSFLVAACFIAASSFRFACMLVRGIFALPLMTPLLEVSEHTKRSVYHNVEERYSHTLRLNNTKAAIMTKLPWKSFSRMWGILHNLYLPIFLRFVGLNFYTLLFAVDLSEAEEPCILKYRNLATFFRRKLKPGLRPVDDTHILTSPADGKVLYLSRVSEEGVLEQIKGVTYSIRGFLGPYSGIISSNHNSGEVSAGKPSRDDSLSDADYCAGLVSHQENALYQCIIYLGPGDYHHFHSPTNWCVSMRRHIPGELFSVNPGLARWMQGLFSFNERAIYTGTWKHGFFSFTAVGATNVGSIAVDIDKDLITNETTPYKRGSFFDHRFDEDPAKPVEVTKGDHFGEFHLGSTIVLLFEAPKDFEFVVVPGQKLRYGQPLGSEGSTL